MYLSLRGENPAEFLSESIKKIFTITQVYFHEWTQLRHLFAENNHDA